MKDQIKSKERVAEHGEVFTNQREVDAMLDLEKDETERIESRFLEPACGEVAENVLFQIGYRDDITTAHVIRFKGVLYDITRVDVFEGYKGDITLYCKREK